MSNSKIRTPEEDMARSRCRGGVRRAGGRLTKIGDSHVQVTKCAVFPDGLITAFHGWVDLLERLNLCENNPELVTDGIYVADPESMERPLALQIQRELEADSHAD